jgi:hypothetical protein
MTRRNESQRNFNAGEISPRLYARSDVNKYSNALETLTNARVLPHGPVVRRNGTKYIAEVKDSSSQVRLVKFQYSQDDAFILEFGNQYIRFYTNQAQVQESDVTISGATAANPVVITANSHGYSNGDQIFISEVVGMTELNSTTVRYTVANKTTNTFELSGVNGTGYTAYSSGGVANRIYTITSPYSASEVQNIEYVQFGDKIYIVHPSYEPRVLTRTSTTSWSLDTLNAIPEPSYEAGEEPNGTITPAATTGTSVNFTSSVSTFVEADVGRQIKNKVGAGRASIVSITSATVAVCDIVEDFPSTSAIASGDWVIDLSPIAALNFSGSKIGSIITVTSEYTSGSRELPGKTITGATSANPVVITSASHGFANGDEVEIKYVGGMVEINNFIFTVANQATNTFELKGEDGTSHTTYTSGGTATKVLTGLEIDCFRSSDVGKYILANGGVLQITAFTSATEVECEVLKSMNTDDATANWTMEVATWNSTRGYPRAVGLWQERLVFGGTSAQPATLWFSETGIFDGYGAGPDDDDSIEVDLTANQVNEIQWISSSRDLIVGTSGSELTVSPGSGSTITPSSIQQLTRTYYGSNRQQVLQAGEESIFVQNAGRKIRTFRYDYQIDGYTGEDLTFLAEHITENIVGNIAYAQEPDTTIYVILGNGDILAGVYERSQSVIGWSKFTDTGSYEDVQTIGTNNQDEVWVVVNRTINGSTKRYIEVFDNGNGTDRIDIFSDSALIYAAPKTITGVTQANPVVVTANSHGFSNGDKVKLIDVGGTTEVVGTTYIVGASTSNTFELESTTRTSITNSTYRWTASGSGTSEYYLELTGGGDPGLTEPVSVYESTTLLTEGTAGSLSTSEWDWADNDSLGFSTVYVRTSGSVDPDSLTADIIKYGSGINGTGHTAYTSGGEAHKLVTTISGLEHLEGETVQVKVDGGAHPNKTVSSGAITLNADHYEVTVGLSYTTTIKTLKKEFDIGQGTMMGQKSRWTRPQLRVYKSSRPLVDNEFLPARSTANDQDEAVPLFSGDLEYGPLSWDNDGQITITTSDPLPLQLLGIFGVIEGGIK